MCESIRPNTGLNELERAMIDDFCSANGARSPQEQGLIDQSAAELRDQLRFMGLTIETQEQFYVACLVSVATAVNMRKLTEMGVPLRTAEDVANKTIAALRPETPKA